MRNERQAAVRLRLQGRSYSEIQKALGGIPKSTLSGWLKDVVLSDSARATLAKRGREKSTAAIIKRNKRQTAIAIGRKNRIMRASKSEIEKLSQRELLLVGAALYWTEGYKRPLKKNGRELINHYVSFTNSDPALLNMFLRFIAETCNVPRRKIRVEVRIFKHHNKEAVLAYWSKILSVSRDNFTEAYVTVSKSSMGKRPFNRLPYGVVQIRIYDTNLFHKIMGWIDGVKDQC